MEAKSLQKLANGMRTAMVILDHAIQAVDTVQKQKAYREKQEDDERMRELEMGQGHYQ